MDEKEARLFARAKAFLYENAPAQYGFAWKASFVLEEQASTSSAPQTEILEQTDLCCAEARSS